MGVLTNRLSDGHVAPAEPQLPRVPEIDPAAPLLFIINAASGRHDSDTTRQQIEAALRASGRTGELLFTHPDQLAQVAQQAAVTAFARHSAVVAVGGDGTIINASLGLYPELLLDREACKTRFGRSRVVAFAAALVTLLGQHRQLRLRIERGATVRDLTTPTLFVGNNRLQLEQVGLAQASALDQGCLAAVMLRPIGALAMLWLLLRGSFGTLGEADMVESFQFHRMLVKPRLAWGGGRVKVAFDGEVNWMRAPLEFRVSPKPLYLIKPMTEDGATGRAGGGA